MSKAFSPAEQALIKLDPTLSVLIKRQAPLVFGTRGTYFESLVRSIVGQQLSVKAAQTIYGRLKQATKLNPLTITRLDETQIKTIGLSRSKAAYITDLAQHFVEDSAVFNHLDSLSDDEVITELTAIKGIGVWTAQMFLMFTLARPDIFAADDVGLQQAMKRLYKWETVPKRAELEAFAERWAPYRTTASLHLWHSLDNTPT